MHCPDSHSPLPIWPHSSKFKTMSIFEKKTKQNKKKQMNGDAIARRPSVDLELMEGEPTDGHQISQWFVFQTKTKWRFVLLKAKTKWRFVFALKWIRQNQNPNPVVVAVILQNRINAPYFDRSDQSHLARGYLMRPSVLFLWLNWN